MTFSDVFREKYRFALRAARANDREATLAGLADLYELFAAQYALNNGDSIVVKAKLSYWQDVFGGYIQIIRNCGLQDKRVQKFFGLIDDIDAPSLEDILSGNGAGVLPPQAADSLPPQSVDIAGIVDAEQISQPSDPLQTQPDAPVVTLPDAPNESTSDLPQPSTAQPDAPPTVTDETPAETVAAPAYTPDSLENFIGQRHIVKVLLKEIAIALAQGKHHLDNILLLGNPGLGKTTLMRLIAAKLGVRFEWMDCSQYRNSRQSMKALQNFLIRIARENEPVVIGFDEIHCLPDELQESLLTLLESRVYVSPPDINGNVKRIPIEEFTFIAATTDDNKVKNTIKDRCLRLKFQLVDYTTDELAQIYRTKVFAKGLTITEEAIQICIPRSRGSIRYVNSFVDGLERELYDANGNRLSTHIDRETALKFFEERGIDNMGLENKDIEILNVLNEANSPMGAETLSARVGLDPKKYLSEFEPYLIKIGFVDVSGRGRSLTEKAKEYLKEKEK